MRELILYFFLIGNIIPIGKPFLLQVPQRDSVLIGDRIIYGCELEDVPDTVKLVFPDYSKEFVEGLVVTGPWQIDSVRVSRRKEPVARRRIRASFSLTGFDEGEYRLPPIAVERIMPSGQVDTLVFQTAPLEIKTMPVDTATFVPHDIKDQMRYPLTLRETAPWIFAFYGLVAIIVAAVCLIMMRKRKDGPAYNEPAHITALRILDKYRSDKYWEPDRQKQFYSGVTDAIRAYISSRYGVSAMEKTTAEIFDGLKETDLPAGLYEEMKDLFERADFVKFAKYVCSREENAEVLPRAVRFVTETYQAQLDEEASAGEEKGGKE